MRFNGVDLLSLHPAISIAKEIPPGMPERELRTVARRQGEKIAGVNIKRSDYVVRVNVAAKTWEEAWALRAMVAQWATSSGGKAAELEPTHWPQVVYDAIAAIIDPPEFVFHQGVMEVTFALPDGYAREQIPSIAHGSGGATMEIGGSAETAPVITFTLAANAQHLEMTLDDKTFFALKDLKAGDVVVIDMTKEAGRVTINGVDSLDRIDYTKTDWLPGFAPGLHTLAASAAGTLEVRWHNRWA